MKYLLKSLPLAIIAVLAGCAAASSESSPASAVLGISSSQLYAAMFRAADAATFARKVSVLRTVSVAGYYEGLLQHVSNAPLTLDGLTITGLHDRLQARMALLEELNASYPTLGDLWDAFGVNPGAQRSEADFQALLAGAFKPSAPKSGASLALAGNGLTGSMCPNGVDAFQLPIAQAMGLPGDDNEYVITPEFSPGGETVPAGRGTPVATWINGVNAALNTADPKGAASGFQYARLPEGTGVIGRSMPASSDLSRPRGPYTQITVQGHASDGIEGRIEVNYYKNRGKAVVTCYLPKLDISNPAGN